MTVYIDSDFICHAETAEDRRAFDVDFFDDKCTAFIEAYRYVPDGETWTRSDGVQFTGEMISPAANYAPIAAAQAQYETDSENMVSMEDAAEMMDTIEELCNEIIGEE